MFRKLALLLTLSLLPVVCSGVAAQSLPPASDLPPADEWIPEAALISFEISRPKALLELLAAEPVLASLRAMPAFQRPTATQELKEFYDLVAFLEASLGADWRTLLAKLAGGGVTFAAGPRNTTVLMIDSEDEIMLEQLHQILLGIARSEASKQGEPDRVTSKDYLGVTAWTFDGKEAHALVGKRLILASSKEVLQAVLDVRSGERGASLATVPSYQAAKEAVGSEAAATLFANLQVLKQVPDVAKALEQDRRNPMAALLFAGVTEALRASSWLGAGLDVAGEELVLRVLVDGKSTGSASAAAFAFPHQASEGALPNLSVPRRIAGLSLYRDLHRFYAAKDELFPERTSELIFFENMMGIFFTGRDLTDEVLARTQPPVRVVVAEQEYDPAIGTPQVQLPAFAVVFRLRDPDAFDAVLEEAWQKALGLINFTRGQQALPGLIIDRATHGGTKLTVASYSTTGIEDRTDLPQRFNFRPTLTMPGDYLILSSTEALARDLIDALERETAVGAEPLVGCDSLLEIDGGYLASILTANRTTLIRNDMVDKGHTQQEAETSIDVLLTLIRLAGSLSARTGAHEGPTQARLELALNPPL
ncbi:MAG: hypothetical protein AB1486_19815 [Planctomycetota bacterium]